VIVDSSKYSTNTDINIGASPDNLVVQELDFPSFTITPSSLQGKA
jgi:hypothetical protein